MHGEMERLIVPPSAGKTIWLGGLGVIFKVSGEATGKAFSIVEHPLNPGTLASPHVHVHEDEFSFVLEGEIGVRLGAREFVVMAGSYVLKPRGIPHAFWNAGPKPARMMEIISPAGFEKYFEELAGLFPAEGRPDPERVAALRSRYGLQFVDWIAELTAKYNLRQWGR